MAKLTQFFLYARKSTDVEDKQVRSIDAQLSELREFAIRNGFFIVDVIIERESAKTPGRRSKFNAMLDRIERGEAEGILAWHPDRLARNMTDGGRIIDLIDTGKLLALSFPTFWFDTTPQGKFMLAMAFSQSKYYVDSLAENTKRGLREKVRRGEFHGHAPIGYINDVRTKLIVADPVKSWAVKRALERYGAGTETIETTRNFLAEHGVASRNGKPIGTESINKILSNPIYYGQFRFAGELHDGIHEPLISKRVFDRVQAVRAGRYRYSPTVVPREPKAFTGLLRCAECGCCVTAEVQKGHTYYRCTKKHKVIKCSQSYIREETLAREIDRALDLFALRKDWAKAMLQAIADERQQGATDSAALLAGKRKQIEALRSKLARLVDMRLNGEIDEHSYFERRAKLMSQRKTFEEEAILISKGQQPWLEPLKKWVLTAQNLAEIVRTGSLSDKKGLAAEIFGSNLLLSGKKARGEAVKPWAFLADNELSHDWVPLLEVARTFYREHCLM